jgi:hypothetical protein
MNSALHHHIRTLGSMQAGSIDFVSNVLPTPTRSYSSISTEKTQLDQFPSSKTNTGTSTSSSGYESVLSKSHKSFFHRLKRLINYPSSKKSADYNLSIKNNYHDQNSSNSPILSPSRTRYSNENKRNSLTRLDIKRLSSRRTLSPASQHVPFLYGLKNCGNTW